MTKASSTSKGHNLPTVYQQFIHQTRYARYVEAENRRETWDETVLRYVNFMTDYVNSSQGGIVDDNIKLKLYNAIGRLEVMPSMRALMTAGPALERNNAAGYNCSYLPMRRVRDFSDALLISLCGVGVGYSVERQDISKLPTIKPFADVREEDRPVIVVQDSKEGWQQALNTFIINLYEGRSPRVEYHLIRQKGAILKTFGGKASGPEPLQKALEFARKVFHAAQGRKLDSLEVNDVMCKIGESVVSGGVRRVAFICLSNLSDFRMQSVKSGNWFSTAPHRSLANHSIAFTEKPEVAQWMREWSNIYESKSGERGIFNRNAAVAQSTNFGRDTKDSEGVPIPFGTNPCGEIILRPYQFCNLTEVVARAEDTAETLLEKVRLATILGTFQSCLTDIKGLGPEWKENTESERLLGVSITGIKDCPLLSKGNGRAELLRKLRAAAIQTNAEWADKIGIPRSAAITCVKPSGTVSLLVDSSAGIHARPAAFYIRRIRNSDTDIITKAMEEHGVPSEPDAVTPNTSVLSFPMKAGDPDTVRGTLSAVEQLEEWKLFKENWCMHNASTTITLKEDEWPEVGAWVWENFDSVLGVSFLPHFEEDSGYVQMPEETIIEEEYNRRLVSMPTSVDWSSYREKEDNTTASQEPACTGGACII